MLKVFAAAMLLALVFSFCPPSLLAQDFSGVWKGEWRSFTTGHHGPMRVRVRELSDGTYRAAFAGRFAVVIPFFYRTRLEPGWSLDGSPTLVAQKNLGPIFGSYTMQVASYGDRLQGGYRASGDQGRIYLRRRR